MWQRILSQLDGDTPGTERTKIRSYQVLFALVVCTEYWTKALGRWGDLSWDEHLALGLVTVLAALVLEGRLRRSALAGFVLLQAWYVWSLFPNTGNHRYLELIIAFLFAWLDDEDEDERRLLLQSLRFVVVVVLFYSGVQKLIHGHWFRGQFLAWSLWRENFRVVLEPLLSAEDAARLATYGDQAGEGPFLVSSLPFVFLSNAVWVLEIGLGLLLVPRVTRRLAWIAALAFVVATEVVARELMFGVEFGGAILLFARGDLVRRAVWPLALFLLLLVLIRLGLAGEALFH